MGSFLSWPRPRPPPSALAGGDPLERPKRQAVAPAGGCAPRANRIHSGAPTLDVARRCSYEDLVASPRRRQPRRRQLLAHQRQYPSRQARCLVLGLFSAAPRGRPQKAVLPACGAKMFCASRIWKMAPARGRLTLRLALQQAVFCMWSSLSGHLGSPGVKEAQALERGRPPRAKKEKAPAALARGATRPARREEGHPGPKSQDPPGRGSEGDPGARSAFRRLMVNGVLCPFVPRPGPLRICPRIPPDGSAKAPPNCFLSSCSKRNAITSSYSSTRGFAPLPRPRGPESPLPRVPAEKAGGESRPSSASVAAEPPREPAQKGAEAPAERKQDLSWSPASAREDSRLRRRRFPLLPRRRGNQLILPSAPEPGYAVTAEDLDSEKRARLQRILMALEG